MLLSPEASVPIGNTQPAYIPTFYLRTLLNHRLVDNTRNSNTAGLSFSARLADGWHDFSAGWHFGKVSSILNVYTNTCSNQWLWSRQDLNQACVHTVYGVTESSPSICMKRLQELDLSAEATI